MTAKLRALLLIGSAKPPGESSSELLAGYLGRQLEARGCELELVHVLRVSHRSEVLLDQLKRAQLLVLASPLYVDALPYLVVQAFERIAAARQALPGPPPLRFAALINCGFPEPEQCATALEICRLFARDAGLDWAGGLALGQGGALGHERGRTLEQLDGRVRNVRAALELAAEALADGRDLPERAVELMARPILPRFMYMLMGNAGWVLAAAQRGALTQLGARPYESQDG